MIVSAFSIGRCPKQQLQCLQGMGRGIEAGVNARVELLPDESGSIIRVCAISFVHVYPSALDYLASAATGGLVSGGIRIHTHPDEVLHLQPPGLPNPLLTQRLEPVLVELVSEELAARLLVRPLRRTSRYRRAGSHCAYLPGSC